MQFKGSLRSPGDRGPGIRVSLVVDDFHLEILRGSDLMGRWYLADVEVKREIAERFTLFLGDDEMEFLADDALVFAYEGVTRMQEGWVNAKKRKRRHRRAAADAARRKDEAPIEPAPVKVEEPTRPQATKKVPTSDLAKKLAAIASAEAAANDESEKRRLTWAEAEALELAEASKSEPPPPAKKPRKRAAPKEEPAPSGPLYTEPYSPPPPPRTPPRVEPSAVESPAVAPAVAAEAPKEAAAPRPKRKRPPRPSIEHAPVVPEPVAPEPVAAPPIQPPPVDEPVVKEPEPEPSWIAPPPPARLVTVDLSVEEPLVIETPFAGGEAQEAPAPPEIEEEASDELTKRRQRRKSRRETAPDDQVLSDEVTEARQITNIEAARGKVKEPKGAGHHPAETNVGLLAKLRRPPKADQEHVHTYEESRSAGGLTRRVCVECSHVSITSDD